MIFTSDPPTLKIIYADVNKKNHRVPEDFDPYPTHPHPPPLRRIVQIIVMARLSAAFFCQIRY